MSDLRLRQPGETPALGRFVVPATIMLSFVSFWRASAIVLSDLGSSAYYVGGIAEQKVGKAAPWFVLGIMLFSYAVRAVYIESCSMFTRGGVYKVVREAMGGTAAKFSVSALMFDYVLTGPISAVSAGLYLASLLNQLAGAFGMPQLPLSPPLIAAAFAILVISYFWWTNTVGIPFSSTRALRVMQITTVMVVILVSWCLLTIAMKGYQPVPAPTLANLKFSDDALGWLKGTPFPGVAVIAIGIGLGHSLLAMSGEESLAQVYREIEAPKRKNLIRTGLIIFGYSLVFTALVSFFAVMLIPDDQRQQVQDNLISGIAMVLIGRHWLKLAFQCFVVLVGVLILSAAVNTSLIGSNGVLNRVAEDGVLPDWVCQPHKTYGTSHRLIAIVAALQIATVVLSRGDVTLLGEAYAFGVAWSFAMKALGVTVLRFTRPDAERWRVPLNIKLGTTELPLGLIIITTMLFILAGLNLFTKEAATVGGVAFTVVFFVLFTVSEHYHKRGGEEGNTADNTLDRFRLECRRNLSPEALGVRPGSILVAVHDADQLDHLQKALAHHDPSEADVVAISASESGPGDNVPDDQAAQKIVDAWETRVFSRAVAVAEKEGKPISLIGLAAADGYSALLAAAATLQCSRLVLAASTKESVREQEQDVRTSWRKRQIQTMELPVEIISRSGTFTSFTLER
ncbi:APC family permease [Lichenifustis flavocetrariae]|uniref:APC family permease n=1 Tax=Lichenifustis flavocetrariae TaxID=2949735 RepID=A0AA41Z810_9HYPH|nr:APC family permease [Lichenifustis flavocetrariae]MCW6512203.1 APC family permease [Lichenifustis flavocetrariae]